MIAQEEVAENTNSDVEVTKPTSCMVGLIATVLILVVLVNFDHMPPLVGLFLLWVLLRPAWRGFNGIPDLLVAEWSSRSPGATDVPEDEQPSCLADPTDVPEGEQHRRR